MKSENNPQAFPLAHGTPADDWGHFDEGMTLRDYFAAQVIGGIVSGHLAQSPDNYLSADGHPDMTEEAYEIADAMLAARTGDSA